MLGMYPDDGDVRPASAYFDYGKALLLLEQEKAKDSDELVLEPEKTNDCKGAVAEPKAGEKVAAEPEAIEEEVSDLALSELMLLMAAKLYGNNVSGSQLFRAAPSAYASL